MKNQKSFYLKYAVVIVITGGIFFFLLKSIPIQDFRSALKDFNYNWIFVSMGLTLISHYLRSWRWRLLVNSEGYKLKAQDGYNAIMINYLLNSLVPRLGEVSRCGVGYKKAGVPIPFALGTVVTERVIDLLMLIAITFLTFSLQFNLLRNYWLDGKAQVLAFLNDYQWFLIIAGIVGLLVLYLVFFTKLGSNLKLIDKIRGFIKQATIGFLSLRKVKNQVGFWSSTIAIWVLYFFMLYVITLGSELSNHIGIFGGLSILVMGSFGMASPTPNGLVTFHAFVAGVLVLYGIEYSEGIIIATILHTSQLITVLIFGSISLILVNRSSNYAKESTEDLQQKSA